jgi:putative methyltransferase (TIGR04325 family)
MAGPFGRLHQAVDSLRVLPGLRHLGRWAYGRKFAVARNTHLFHGYFLSQSAAQNAVPKTRSLGYDNSDSAKLYTERLQIDDYDYPALFWIKDSFDRGLRQVVDLGGSIGIKFYAFSSSTKFPTDISWTVVDVPSVVEEGRRFAVTHAAPSNLRFSTSIPSNGVDVLYVSGALQYLPQTLREILEVRQELPRRIVINTAALHDSKSFFTLNNIGTAICVYRIHERSTFVKEIESLGYSLRDSWLNVGKKMTIPFELGLDIENYSGFCFDLDAVSPH